MQGFCDGSSFCGAVLCALSKFCNHLAEKARAGCFTSIVFLLSCGCLCVVSLLEAVGWSVVVEFPERLLVFFH